MGYGELRPHLNEMARSLRTIAKNTCNSTNTAIAGSQADANPLTLASGYNSLNVVKTNGSGTVTITFPNGNTYPLTTSGQTFTIAGNLGEFSINAAGGGTYTYYAY